LEISYFLMCVFMNKIAVDIVLFPSVEIIEKSIKLNKDLISDFKPVKLNNENCFPHISLCMGSIESNDLDKAELILNKISKDFKALKLTISKFVVDSLTTGDKWTSLKVKKTEELQKLHEKTMDKFKEIISSDIEKEMFFLPYEINDLTVVWAKNYFKNSAYKNYSPHISIGIGKQVSEDLNLSFLANNIGICQLGKYCTCRKVIMEKKLS
jgi:hypothetical protein